jgi:hypothetical protein
VPGPLTAPGPRVKPPAELHPGRQPVDQDRLAGSGQLRQQFAKVRKGPAPVTATEHHVTVDGRPHSCTKSSGLVRGLASVSDPCNPDRTSRRHAARMIPPDSPA